MSKTLTIMRHAKSSWEDIAVVDSARPIIPKGIKRTKKSIRFLDKTELVPGQIWSSPAKRAVQTAQIVIDKLNIDSTFHAVPEFYEGNIDKMIHQIEKCSNKINHLLIVGHNPHFTEMACRLAKKTIIDWIPTSGMVVLNFNSENWSGIQNAEVNVVHIIKPKLL